MRKLVFLLLVSIPLTALTQETPVEPMQSSYENKDLIMLALAAFGVLVAVYFLWRRAKKRRPGN
jgi:hypothetical protein